MRRHAHGDERRLDVRVRIHGLVVAVRTLHAELLGRGLRRVRMGRADGIELRLRQPLKGRDMRPRTPSSVCSDKSHA